MDIGCLGIMIDDAIQMSEGYRMVHTERLTKAFDGSSLAKRRPVTALCDVTMEVKKSEIFSLIGPNGAGKSTLIRILSTLLLPTSGEAWVNGYNIVRDGARVRASIGLSPGGERSFYFRLTGRQNLEFFGALQGLPHRTLRQRINEVLDLVDLASDADRQFMTYSTGLRRRLSIARSLLSSPPLVIMDEPTASVDPASASRIREYMLELKRAGHTVILTTHNLHEAEQLSDRIGLLQEGRLGPVDTPTSFRQASRQRHVRIKVLDSGSGCSGFVHALGGIPSVLRVTEQGECLTLITSDYAHTLTAALTAIVQSGLAVDSVTAGPPSLEEVYLTLTGGLVKSV